MYWDFPGGAGGKEPACQGRRQKRCGFSPWVGRIPEEGNGNLLQYSCWENPTDRGVWWAAVYGITKGQTQLSTHTLLLLIRHTNKLLTQVWGTRDMDIRSTLSEVKVAQSCLTLCDPKNCSPPHFSIHGIFPARILEWIVTPSSRDSS